MRCSFPAKSHFRAVDAVNARVAGGGAASGNNDVAGQEAELHEATRDIFGKVETIEHTGFALGELSEGARQWVIRRRR